MSLMIHTAWKEQQFSVDLDKPLDISLPLKEGSASVKCFYAPAMEVEPLISGTFTGSTLTGGSVNFLNLKINPHGNGTHTECLGHIATVPLSINSALNRFHFIAKLVSLEPTTLPNGDMAILREQLEATVKPGETDALILRTLPNGIDKQTRDYSGSNPPYIHHEAMEHLVSCGVNHLLLDLPSVDKEQDGGQLLAHRVFWNMPWQREFGTLAEMDLQGIRYHCTITELIFVPELIHDGFYLLNLQIASFEIDVSPSKPVLYALKKITET